MGIFNYYGLIIIVLILLRISRLRHSIKTDSKTLTRINRSKSASKSGGSVASFL